jgi:hypothetical protein
MVIIIQVTCNAPQNRSDIIRANLPEPLAVGRPPETEMPKTTDNVGGGPSRNRTGFHLKSPRNKEENSDF